MRKMKVDIQNQSDIQYDCHVVVEEKWQNVMYFELSHPRIKKVNLKVSFFWISPVIKFFENLKVYY